ncbi:hypothetical protein P692DRAFT_20878360 [Suillus brevipes Sb2]|nr:hypothetical protein P692DRAFT_20878360 [Suillus brevipes Sb2]
MLTISDNEEVQLEEPENIVMVELSTTPVATQPELEVAADDVPLYDVQQFYNSEQFTPIVEEVWKYFTGPTPAKSHTSLSTTLTPRLTYDYNEHLLVIDMPTVLHEAFYDDLKKLFTLAMDRIPYHRRTINPQVHMNYPLQIIDKSVTPDMAISLTTTEEPTEVLLIPFIGETAVTEEWAHVFRKVESMIEEYPEAIYASIVLIREAKHYVYPARKSTAQRRCIIRSTPRTFEHPVRVANHTWCHIQSVKYFLWIKGDNNQPIDMHNRKAEHRAHGTLVPEFLNDSLYEPSEVEEDANTKPALTHSKSRCRPSKAPPPQTFHSIAMADVSSSDPVAAGPSSKSSSSSNPKKNLAGKPKPSKGAKTSGGGHSGKGPNKYRKV